MTQWGLDTLFNPAKRHMDEEKRRLQSTREEIGDSSGGKRIDLESGKVTISRGQSKDDDDTESETAELVDGAAAEPQAADNADADEVDDADASASN
ncbi:MAG: hypothetical protein DLM57_15690 [Pseudonocardiales bacterium]|nr:MAG: hypothetical protein DLM57_15690 [Pseudonocardiales bacterium]